MKKMNNNLKYCIPIIKTGVKDVLKMIDQNINDYDYFEVWMDYIEDIDINFVKKLESKLYDRLLIIFRRQNLEPSKISWKNRIEILNLLNRSKTLVDFDLFSQSKELAYVKKNKIKLRKIVSYHNYKETPIDKILVNIIKKMQKCEPYIYKISTFCKEEKDAIRLMRLLLDLKEKNKQYIVLGMGEKGLITRIYGTLAGNVLNFAPKTLEDKSAPGQLTKNALETIINIISTESNLTKKMQAKTQEQLSSKKICAIIKGNYRSLSPKIHKVGYDAIGLSDQFDFIEIELKQENLKEQIYHFRNLNENWRGISVGAPHKKAVIQYLDKIDDAATAIGAVNTIIIHRRQDKTVLLEGTNTDWLGFVNALKDKGVMLKGKKIAVVGAGGAARATIFGAVMSGATKITVFARKDTDENGLKDRAGIMEKFANKVDINIICLDKLSSLINEFDILVNATNVGTHNEKETIIPFGNIDKEQQSRMIFVGWPYTKGVRETKDEFEAMSKNIKTITGRDILFFQALPQFELYTGKKAPAEVMRKAFNEATN